MARTFRMLIVILGILLMVNVTFGQLIRQGAVELKPGSEPDGFRGITWGTDISTLKDMTLVLAIDDDVKRYQRKGDVLRIGEAKLDHIHYEFWKGKFYLVEIEAQGIENWNDLKRTMFTRFGEGQNMPGEEENRLESYRWEGEKTAIIMIYDSTGGGITISSIEIMDEKQRGQTE